MNAVDDRDPTPFEQVVFLLDTARRHITEANRVEDREYIDMARTAIATAEKIINEHQPAVVHHTIRQGRLRVPLSGINLYWTQVYDELRGTCGWIRWSEINGEVRA